MNLVELGFYKGQKSNECIHNKDQGKKKEKTRESSNVQQRKKEVRKIQILKKEIKSIRIKIMSSITYIKMPTKWFINEY